MPHGGVARRAVFELVAVVSILAPTAGCQRLSFARNDRSMPPPLAPTAALPPLVASPVPAPAPGALMSSVQNDRTTPVVSAPANPPQAAAGAIVSSTPLLDAALERAVVRGVVEPPPSEIDELPETKPDPTRERVESEEPDPRPSGLVVLPPLAPAPKETPSETETLKASATAVLDPSREKLTAPPRPINPDRPADPTVSWREGVDGLKRLAHDRLADPDDSSALWRVREQLLDGLDQAARADESGILWRTIVAALIESETADERARAAGIRRAVRAIEDQAPLEIMDLRLCRKVNGFGSFEPVDPSACKSGQAVIVYCEMSGLRYEEVGEMFRSRLATQVEIVSSQGGEAAWKESLGTADDLCRRRRRDYYVCYRINLPEKLPPGSYELRMTQDDLVAGRSTTAAIPVTVRP
jgi:hypothetical protein